MEMFEPGTLEERIGYLKKASNLKETLEEVEAYAINKLKDAGLEHSYDVIAHEVPDFITMGYTEYATNFVFQPLSLSAREAMMVDALHDDCETTDYTSLLRDNIKNNKANKYQDRNDPDGKYVPKKILVVLPGSNKLKQKVCLNKLKEVNKIHKGDVLFKPHPITTHAVIGELKDLFGEDAVLPRDTDIYYYLQKAEKVYTTHMSESAIYAVALGKTIEPIDVFNDVHMSSFYNINRILFAHQDKGGEIINKMLSSYKSGCINPNIDKDWRNKVDKYIEYILDYKSKHKGWYIIKDKENVKKEIQGD
mgnify:CR=1 FL=1